MSTQNPGRSRGGGFYRRLVVAGAVAATLLMALPPPASADHHRMKIREVMAGTSAAPAAQYVQLQMFAPGHNKVGGEALHVYDAAGVEIDNLPFPADVANGANQASILIATDEAASLLGVIPDLPMTAVLPPAGGKVCWQDLSPTPLIDCFSWGNYSVMPPTGTGTPFNASGGGLLANHAAERDISGGTDPAALDAGDDTGQSAADFDHASPTPRNNAGTVGSLPTVGGKPFVYADDASVLEGASGQTTPVTTKIRLSEPSPEPVTVAYTSSQNTATGGVDYTGKAASVTFAPGEVEKSAGPFSVKGDAFKEGTENFQVKLTSIPTANASFGDAVGSVHIRDEEGSLFATIGDESVAEGDAGSATAAFKVKLSEAPGPGQTVSVKYATADGTATLADGDYASTTGTLTFTSATGPEQTVNVAVGGDAAEEPNEIFSLKLSAPKGVTLSDLAGTATIVNDDGTPGEAPKPFVYADDASLQEGDTGQTTPVTTKIRLSEPSPDPVTVAYTSAQNTATGGVDYTGKAASVTFAPGEVEKPAGPFSVKGDTLKEGVENFQVKLTSIPTANASFGDQTASVYIDDEEGALFATISDVARLEGDAGSADFAFKVKLSEAPAPGQTVSVKYATADGSATLADGDYSSTTGTLTFTSATGPEQTVNVAVGGDTATEPTEAFKLKLSNAKGLTISDFDGGGTIFNDD